MTSDVTRCKAMIGTIDEDSIEQENKWTELKSLGTEGA